MKTLKAAFFMLFCLPLFGANATPVSVSSTTVAGNVITVNTAAAHGLAVNQGACLSAPSTVCGVVQAVNTTTKFTLLTENNTPAACASSCGTSYPAPQVIVLRTYQPSQGQLTVSYVLWLTTQQPCPGPSTSVWTVASSSAGSLPEQVAAISSGLFIEKQKSLTVASNTSTATLTVLLQSDYAMEQQAVANNAQPCQWYGQVFDGTGWGQK